MKHNLKTFPEATGDEDWYYMLKWKEDFEAELRDLEKQLTPCISQHNYKAYFEWLFKEISGEKEVSK